VGLIPGFDLGNFINNAASAAGHAAQSLADDVSKIPVIGSFYHATLDMYSRPFQIQAQVIQAAGGKGNLVDVAKENLAAYERDAKEEAPLAETVLAFVPGLGTGIDAALAAGFALADGKSLSDAALAAVGSALPGGSAAEALYDAGRTVGNAQSASAMTRGYNALEARAKSQDDRDAIQIGVALQHGHNLQSARGKVASRTDSIGRLVSAGRYAERKSAQARAARVTLRGKGLRGFDAGLGLMSMRAAEHEIKTTRASLRGDDVHGFDLALSLHIGAVKAPLPPRGHTAAAAAGWNVTHGMMGSAPEHKASLMRTVASTRGTRAGAVDAANAISKSRGRAGAVDAANAISKSRGQEGFFAWVWHLFRSLLGLEEKTKAAVFKAGDELAAKDVRPAPKPALDK
jgi:hypothetical protein